MSTPSITRTPKNLASRTAVNSRPGLTMDAVIPHPSSVTQLRKSNANSSFTRSPVIVGAEHGLPVFLEFRSGVYAIRFANTKT